MESDIAHLDFPLVMQCEFGKQPPSSQLPSNQCSERAATALTIICPAGPPSHTTTKPLCDRHAGQMRVALANVRRRSEVETGGVAGDPCAIHWHQDREFVQIVTMWSPL